MRERIEGRFADLRAEGRAGLVTFLCGGDPDPETSLKLIRGLPEAGADLIEIGMPFSDPMADGPSIQAGNLRALKAGMTLPRLLDLVRAFRRDDDATPVILMGYYNPIHRYGPTRFLDDAIDAGVDGLIVVDLPPEEDGELCLPALDKGLAFVRLATPTTDDARLSAVLANTAGFIYYVSITGITGAAAPVATRVGEAVARLKRHTDLPVGVGFGIREPAQAAEIARQADAAVGGRLGQWRLERIEGQSVVDPFAPDRVIVGDQRQPAFQRAFPSPAVVQEVDQQFLEDQHQIVQCVLELAGSLGELGLHLVQLPQHAAHVLQTKGPFGAAAGVLWRASGHARAMARGWRIVDRVTVSSNRNGPIQTGTERETMTFGLFIHHSA